MGDLQLDQVGEVPERRDGMRVADRRPIGLALAALALGFPAAAYAHVTAEAGQGFMSGLLHPVFGLDHFLAMLSVGIVSAQLGGRRIYTVPATFVLSMIVGATIGVYGYRWPLSEAGIATSVVVLGTAIATVRQSARSWPVMAVVAFFGSLHGHAHGLEMPRAADPVYYAAGFLFSTAAIHLLGVGVGHLFTRRLASTTLLRHMGSAMAGMGLMMLVTSVTAS
jgi:urease accessory protein